MKIAITGTRGIPNRYGGFERFAERLSTGLVRLGQEVWVYNAHYHEYRKDKYQEVRLIRKRHPEGLMGPAANYIYDLSCIRDAIRQGADIILECGYASAAPWYRLLNTSGTKLITHMDGMEWQREKWKGRTAKMIRNAEATAVLRSHKIICDSPPVADYYRGKYAVEPVMIPYGGDIRSEWNEGILTEWQILPGEYYLLVARLEPENNVRMIIRAFLESECRESLLIAGDYSAGYGKKVFRDYKTEKRIRFLGGIWDQQKLDHLRHYSKAILHGHSAGGTNPSLLEGMACGAPVIAHDNPFNRWILEENAAYFNTEERLTTVLNAIDQVLLMRDTVTGNNIDRINSVFRWDVIVERYAELFREMLAG